jgi:hypothetical protein
MSGIGARPPFFHEAFKIGIRCTTHQAARALVGPCHRLGGTELFARLGQRVCPVRIDIVARKDVLPERKKRAGDHAVQSNDTEKNGKVECEEHVYSVAAAGREMESD